MTGLKSRFDFVFLQSLFFIIFEYSNASSRPTNSFQVDPLHMKREDNRHGSWIDLVRDQNDGEQVEIGRSLASDGVDAGFPVKTTSTVPGPPKSTNIEHSSQIHAKSKLSSGGRDPRGGGGGGKASANSKVDVAASFHQFHHREETNPHHSPQPSTPTRHQNSVHKRSAGGISPPDLFLRIFMDYSSLNDDDFLGGGDRRPRTDRRRANRSFRVTSSKHERDANETSTSAQQQQMNPNSELNLTASITLFTNQNLSHPAEGDPATSSNTTLATDTPPSSSPPSTTSSSVCPVGHFGCSNDASLCVPQSAVCNGKPECPDGSDEYKCVNIHEKKFWDSFFQKRPAADVDREAGGNATCLYNTLKKSMEKGEARMTALKATGVENDFGELLAQGICRCSLEKVICHNVHLPDLKAFPPDIQFLDLSGSQIDDLEFPTGQFFNLQTLVLSACSIEEVTTSTFSTLSSLRILHLTGNQLRRIPPSTFSENSNLSKLFLGHNQLETLDSQSFHGLPTLEYLDLRKNRLTGEESAVFESLSSLRILHLSFNEIRSVHKDFLKGISQLEMFSLTKNKVSSIALEAFNHVPLLKHLYLSYNRLSVLESGMFCNLHGLLNLNLNDNGIRRIDPGAFDCLDSLQSLILEKNPFRELLDQMKEDGKTKTAWDPRQLFLNLTNLQHIYFDEWWMCWWAPHVRSCEPKGDGISSVDNLLDNVILRVCVWIMGSVGVGGNIFVIISRLVIREKNKAHSFYIKNLAIADLLMGLFLISIAFHDMQFRGHFLAHQHAWRHSITCQLSGMMSTLSSEASVLILVLITLDRYLSIVRPFAERRNALIPAVLICTLLWTLSIFLSYAPMCPWFQGYFGKNFYTSNGLCLPLHIHNPYEKGWQYSLFLFVVINSVAFTFICFAYWRMLRIIQTSTTSIRSTQQKQDGMLVKRFGLVVVTDFMCWAPIIIVKCIAMTGVYIQSDWYAYFAVFVLPVNSALNPVIYSLSTRLFQQQVTHFTVGFRKRLGLATDESMTSSNMYRNRISRTLQTSMNSSMMYSTRRHGSGGYGDSTRATVLKDKMAMANRMSSKVGSYSPPTPANGPKGSSETTAATTGDTGPHVISVPYSEDCKVGEINGQIAAQHEASVIEGNDKDVIVESQL